MYPIRDCTGSVADGRFKHELKRERGQLYFMDYLPPFHFSLQCIGLRPSDYRLTKKLASSAATEANSYQWHRLHGAPAPHTLLLMSWHGGTVSRGIANKNLTKLYWPPWKRSPKRLIVLLEPKSGGAWMWTWTGNWSRMISIFNGLLSTTPLLLSVSVFVLLRCQLTKS